MLERAFHAIAIVCTYLRALEYVAPAKGDPKNQNRRTHGIQSKECVSEPCSALKSCHSSPAPRVSVARPGSFLPVSSAAKRISPSYYWTTAVSSPAFPIAKVVSPRRSTWRISCNVLSSRDAWVSGGLVGASIAALTALEVERTAVAVI